MLTTFPAVRQVGTGCSPPLGLQACVAFLLNQPGWAHIIAGIADRYSTHPFRIE